MLRIEELPTMHGQVEHGSSFSPLQAVAEENGICDELEVELDRLYHVSAETEQDARIVHLLVEKTEIAIKCLAMLKAEVQELAAKRSKIACNDPLALSGGQ